MTENAKKFLERASQDVALKTELEAAIKKAQAEAAKKVASAHGFNLADEDLKADEKMAALSDDELKAVAGGSTCACPMVGAGFHDLTCSCVAAGAGTKTSTKEVVCYCAIGGGGRS